jgi:hypothetical protein
MSEQDRQEQIAETLSLLGQLTPAALAADRDLLFFRAGEASARGELGASSRAHRVVWPAAAALALLAAGLGAALVMREPEVQVVYIERPATGTDRQANTAAEDTTPRDRGERNVAADLAASIDPANEIRHLPNGDGIIHSQDWAALSDAFAQQLRLQQERSQAVREAMMSATIENRHDDTLERDAPRERGQSYLELRDAMRAM